MGVHKELGQAHSRNHATTGLGDALEPVKIELANEGGIFVVLEEEGQDISGEHVNVCYPELRAVFRPLEIFSVAVRSIRELVELK